MKHNFDQSTLATIIDTLVMSKINYCSTVWSNTSDSNLKKIQLIQNCAARLITGVPKYDHISPTLNALVVNQRTSIVERCVINIKCKHDDKAPQYLCDNFEQRNRIHNRDTRRNGELCMRVQLCKYTDVRSNLNTVCIKKTQPRNFPRNRYCFKDKRV
jgi:hypothetical protein